MNTTELTARTAAPQQRILPNTKRRHRRKTSFSGLYVVASITLGLTATMSYAATETPAPLQTQTSKVSMPATTPSRTKPTNVRSMLRWAARISRRPLSVGIKPPVLIAMNKNSLAAIVCPQAPVECSSVVAAYSIETGEIIYRDSFDLNDLLYRSFVVHEMVHYLQHLDQPTQITATCHQILRNEREAYGVQAAYLRRHGSIYASQVFPRMASCQPGVNEEVSLE